MTKKEIAWISLCGLAGMELATRYILWMALTMEETNAYLKEHPNPLCNSGMCLNKVTNTNIYASGIFYPPAATALGIGIGKATWEIFKFAGKSYILDNGIKNTP